MSLHDDGAIPHLRGERRIAYRKSHHLESSEQCGSLPEEPPQLLGPQLGTIAGTRRLPCIHRHAPCVPRSASSIVRRATKNDSSEQGLCKPSRHGVKWGCCSTHLPSLLVPHWPLPLTAAASLCAPSSVKCTAPKATPTLSASRWTASAAAHTSSCSLVRAPTPDEPPLLGTRGPWRGDGRTLP
jgi:hypothetical protein